MTPIGWVLCAGAAVVAIANTLTMRPLWSSAMFEKPQKVAQTVLVWLIPGAFILVRHVLREPLRPKQIDSTIDNHGSASDSWDAGGLGHHGGGADGGGHGGF
jgi:hypothetical protein